MIGLTEGGPLEDISLKGVPKLHGNPQIQEPLGM
jgi:hypothetical protein